MSVAKLTNTEVLKRFILKHNKTYDYSKMEYGGSSNKVCIICKDHGKFLQLPHHHMNGRGCPKCGFILSNASRKLSLQNVIFRASKIHKNKYDYSKIKFKTTKDKVCIICPIHGEFKQSIDNHISKSNKNGCPKCGDVSTALKIPGRYNFKLFKTKPWLKNKPAILYFIKFSNECKIGITINSIKRRFYKLKYIILKEIKLPLFEAFKLEQLIKSKYSKFQFLSKILKYGRTECFKHSKELTKNILKEMNVPTT